MALIKHGRLIADPWQTVEDETDLDVAAAPVIVPLALWQQNRAALADRPSPIGIRLDNDQSPDAIANDLHRFDVIVLEFPAFTDGRAYSQARILRQRYGFEGELRAVGNVLRDQVLFMQRCGFDAYEVDDGASLEDWLAAAAPFQTYYQPANDTGPVAARLRTAVDAPPALAAAWAY